MKEIGSTVGKHAIDRFTENFFRKNSSAVSVSSELSPVPEEGETRKILMAKLENLVVNILTTCPAEEAERIITPKLQDLLIEAKTRFENRGRDSNYDPLRKDLRGLFEIININHTFVVSQRAKKVSAFSYSLFEIGVFLVLVSIAVKILLW